MNTTPLITKRTPYPYNLPTLKHGVAAVLFFSENWGFRQGGGNYEHFQVLGSVSNNNNNKKEFLKKPRKNN